jgi:cytochrome c biogenesis protein CcdA
LVGIGLSLVGFAAGIEPDWLRWLGAGLMLLAGAALLVVPLADRFAMAAERVVAPVAGFAQRMSARGLAGQFALGAVLGLAWAPCTGPALGSAVALAAQAETAGRAALVMAAFALGAALPLLAIGYAAREAMPALKRRFGGAGGWMRPTLGAALAGFGLLVLTGADKSFEIWATAALPEGWVTLVTRF